MELRVEFEKLPAIADKLDRVKWNDSFNFYHTSVAGKYADDVRYVAGAWMAYQAVKAQTVPEGYVFVEKKLIKTLHEELLDHEPDSFVVVRDICELWKQAEAQEQGNV